MSRGGEPSQGRCLLVFNQMPCTAEERESVITRLSTIVLCEEQTPDGIESQQTTIKKFVDYYCGKDRPQKLIYVS